MESSDLSLDHKTCEFNVLKAMERNPCVQLLLQAMARNGCPINIRRHISCEPCKGTLKGMYSEFTLDAWGDKNGGISRQESPAFVVSTHKTMFHMHERTPDELNPY